MWSTKLFKATRMPARTAECRTYRKKRHYEKECRLPKKIEYVDKASSLADEDNCVYNMIQNKNNNKKKGDYFHATLLVSDALMKIIIDSRSPVTLIPQCLFNDISEVTKLNSSYKDVNDNKVEFLGQTKATVTTNITALQLLLLITKASMITLMRFD